MRLIDADKLISKFEQIKEKSDNVQDCFFLDGVMAVIDEQPTVEPVRRGKWTEQGEPYINTYECSCCGRWFTLDYGTLKENNYNYCPKCGAKLKGEENL